MITLYPNAVYFKNTQPVRLRSFGGGVRSSITSFSSRSSKRLKELICSCSTNTFIGITLTFPNFDNWEYFDFVEFSRVFKQHFKRSFNLPLIWRLELQLNGRPHYHCIIPIYSFDMDIVSFRFRLKRLWIRHLQDNFIDFPTDTYLCHFALLNSEQGINYLVLHTSKHKLQQISSSGRHWGVVNKSSLSTSALNFKLPKYYENLISRTYRKWLYKNCKTSTSSYFCIKYKKLYFWIIKKYLSRYFPKNFFEKI